ncbi:anthranilate synthase component I family protein [Fodinisporobacter ferrooxydans]|uniref:Anthranilate synthase component I family protein n=1 Tax=Fodinisporobacter ferrooxydans TaxID=2901836 RepID=A0ABY4CF24_9BACL|nr:anthranilate synthase component I family protein [Alicyclobacillaceae bacterium MYW30-H2]
MTTLVSQIPVESHVYEFPRNCEAFSVFQALTNDHGEQSVFLLDSITDIKSKYCSSIIGFRPLISVRVKQNRAFIEGEEVLAKAIRQRLSEADFSLTDIQTRVPRMLRMIRGQFQQKNSQIPPYGFGFLGFFGYDSIRFVENIPDSNIDDRDIDDIHLQIHQVVMQFDRDVIKVIITDIPGIDTPTIQQLESYLHPYEAPVFEGYEKEALRVVHDVPFETFIQNIEKAKEYIVAGDIFQIVISQRSQVLGNIDAQEVYYRLKQLNPSPYMFYVNYGDYLIFGASPEVQVRLENGQAMMKPIAGTSKGKGATVDENVRLRYMLQVDEKERAEHLMLVDLCRNDLGRVCDAGSVHVEKFMEVEEYSHVFHMVSTVTGQVKAEMDLFDVFFSTFPAGTLSGAPKIRAMEIIDELETLRRGPYGGVIGCFDFQGNMNTAIIIRTVVYKNGVCYLQSGAGIVYDSDPVQEWNECGHKLAALRATIL